ncbi:hypothetical protein D3OALGA1CA_558 [Olavius algarvensis associated proteobacterium Delta 3]|nr:hypothetical protein D3OALGA1CA_558 [Olavius algarvensis associated proteobacterium Delta 3]CAB5139005.1 hypothetical protein D3OALGB2SA_4118 [Olavius algarvensis associated proteobacterium Delta 3]
MRDNTEMIEIICPKCQRTEIIQLVKEEMPLCAVCRVGMVIREVLKEGKSY